MPSVILHLCKELTCTPCHLSCSLLNFQHANSSHNLYTVFPSASPHVPFSSAVCYSIILDFSEPRLRLSDEAEGDDRLLSVLCRAIPWHSTIWHHKKNYFSYQAHVVCTWQNFRQVIGVDHYSF